MGITMTTSTVAGLPWVGWPSCSGTQGQVGRDARKGGSESQRPEHHSFMTEGARPGPQVWGLCREASAAWQEP